MAKKKVDKEEMRLKKLGTSKKVLEYVLPGDVKLKRIKQAMSNASDAQILAEYDKQGGLILKTVKTDDGKEYKVVPRGTFFDFDKKAPVEKEKKESVKFAGLRRSILVRDKQGEQKLEQEKEEGRA